MTLQSASHAEDALRHVAQQLSQWRQRRTTPRGRIPPPLWTQAVALTHVLPLSRVAKRLGLCPQRLRRRSGGKAGAAGAPAQPLALPFVEVTPAWRSPTAEVEVQRADGARLRITAHDPSPPLALLLQTFLESCSCSSSRPRAASFWPYSPSTAARGSMASRHSVARR